MVRWDFGKCPIFSRTCVTASIAFATKLRASDICPCSAGSVEAAKSACNFFSTSLRLSAQPSRRFSIRPSYRSHENLALRGLDCKQVFRGGFTMLASYRNRRRRNTGNCGLVLRVLLGCSRALLMSALCVRNLRDYPICSGKPLSRKYGVLLIATCLSFSIRSGCIAPATALPVALCGAQRIASNFNRG